MQITIWEQFSSNHSTSYDIVGTFATKGIAREVADKMRGWLLSILYYDERPDRFAMSLTEKYLSKKYDIEWNEDGIRWNGRPDSIDEVIFQWRNMVIFSCPIESHEHTATPYIELFCKLGASQIHQFFGDPVEMGLYVVCQAPSEAIAKELLERVNQERPKSLLAEYPWYSGRRRIDNYSRVEKILVDGTKLSMKLQFLHGVSLINFFNYLEQNSFTDIEFSLIDESPRRYVLPYILGCNE